MKVLIVVFIIAVAVLGWRSWNRYRNEKQVRDEAISSLHEWAEGTQAFIAIRQEELKCAKKLTSTGDPLPHAMRVCHEQHSLDWKNWATSYPRLAKEKIEDRAIVQATE